MGLRPDQERIVSQTVNIDAGAASHSPTVAGELISVSVAAVGGSATSAGVTVNGVGQTAVTLAALAGSQNYVSGQPISAAAAKTAYDASGTDNKKWVSVQTQVGHEDLHPSGVVEQFGASARTDKGFYNPTPGNAKGVSFAAGQALAASITGATSGTVTFTYWKK